MHSQKANKDLKSFFIQQPVSTHTDIVATNRNTTNDNSDEKNIGINNKSNNNKDNNKRNSNTIKSKARSIISPD